MNKISKIGYWMFVLYVPLLTVVVLYFTYELIYNYRITNRNIQEIILLKDVSHYLDSYKVGVESKDDFYAIINTKVDVSRHKKFLTYFDLFISKNDSTNLYYIENLPEIDTLLINQFENIKGKKYRNIDDLMLNIKSSIGLTQYKKYQSLFANAFNYDIRNYAAKLIGLFIGIYFGLTMIINLLGEACDNLNNNIRKPNRPHISEIEKCVDVNSRKKLIHIYINILFFIGLSSILGMLIYGYFINKDMIIGLGALVSLSTLIISKLQILLSKSRNE